MAFLEEKNTKVIILLVFGIGCMKILSRQTLGFKHNYTTFPFAFRPCAWPYVQNREIEFNEWIERLHTIMGRRSSTCY